MADVETKVEKLDERVTRVENQVSELTANVNGLIRELKDFKDEIRQQNQMRAEEIRELRQNMQETQKSIDSKIDNMQNNMQNMLNSNRNLNIVTILGVAAIVIAVLLK